MNMELVVLIACIGFCTSLITCSLAGARLPEPGREAFCFCRSCGCCRMYGTGCRMYDAGGCRMYGAGGRIMYGVCRMSFSAKLRRDVYRLKMSQQQRMACSSSITMCRRVVPRRKFCSKISEWQFADIGVWLKNANRNGSSRTSSSILRSVENRNPECAIGL